MKKTTLFPAIGLFVAISAVLTAFSLKNTDDSKITFKEFLDQFPAATLPYKLDKDTLKASLDRYVQFSNNRNENAKLEVKPRLAEKYLQFLPDVDHESRFSRMPLTVEPIALLASGDHPAVLYGTSRSFRAAYIMYYVAVFEKNGKQISVNMVGKLLPEEIVAATISTGLRAALVSYKVVWKKNYQDTGIRDNSIEDLKRTGTAAINLLKPTALKYSPIKELFDPEEETVTPASVENAGTK